MPTVIDSLIVQLKLDPNLFNQGQRQALNQLRQFQQQAQQATNQLNTGVGARLRQFFANLGAPLQGINQQLNNLSNQSLRTGSQVASGANVGAAGLTNLASAGLAAYAALKSVQGVLSSIQNATNRGSELGRRAPELGVSTGWASAFARAANAATGVDIEAVYAEQEADRNFLKNWASGQNVDRGRINELQKAGINVSPTDTLEQFQAKAGKRFHEVSQRDPGLSRAYQLGTGFGVRGRFIAQGNDAVNAQVAAQPGTTEEQTKAYDRLGRSIRNVLIAYDSLVDKFIERNPGFAAALETFDKWLRDLQSTPDGMKKVEVAFTAVTAAIVASIVAVVGKFLWANTTLLRTPFGRMMLAAWAVGEAFASPGASIIPGAGDPKILSAPGPRTDAGKAGWGDVLRGFLPWNWNVFKNPAASATIPPAAGSLTIGQLKQHALNAGFSEADAPIMAALSYAESRGDPNAVGDRDRGGSYGVSQINANAWGPVARDALGNPQRAMELAKMVHGKQGFDAWTMYKNKEYLKYLDEANAAKTTNIHPLSAMASAFRPLGRGAPPWASDPDTGGFSRGFNPSMQIAAHRRFISQISTGNSSVNHNIGDVHVHTAATDSDGIARDVNQALRDRLRLSVNPFNVGLDG